MNTSTIMFFEPETNQISFVDSLSDVPEQCLELINVQYQNFVFIHHIDVDDLQEFVRLEVVKSLMENGSDILLPCNSTYILESKFIVVQEYDPEEINRLIVENSSITDSTVEREITIDGDMTTEEGICEAENCAEEITAENQNSPGDMEAENSSKDKWRRLSDVARRLQFDG